MRKSISGYTFVEMPVVGLIGRSISHRPDRSVEARQPVLRPIMKNSGFTLIEVLISILILSIGVLGMTSMQMRALASNRDALLRIEASQITTDLIDRIESNGGSAYGPVTVEDEPATATDCTVNNCTPAAMVAYDTTQWMCSINSTDSDGAQYTACDDLGITGRLPSGEASIATVGDEYAVTVQWTEVKTNKTSSVQLFMQVPI